MRPSSACGGAPHISRAEPISPVGQNRFACWLADCLWLPQTHGRENRDAHLASAPMWGLSGAEPVSPARVVGHHISRLEWGAF